MPEPDLDRRGAVACRRLRRGALCADRPGHDEFAAFGAGEIDITQSDIFSILPALDSGKRLVALGGIHAGRYELYGRQGLQAIRDLKGKKIAVASFGRRGFVSAMLSHVGLDPRKDVEFIESQEGADLLALGKVDATLGFAPEPQAMRAKGIGVRIVGTSRDRPWSQYFCCMVHGNRDFVAKNPVATKTRAARACQGGGAVRRRAREGGA